MENKYLTKYKKKECNGCGACSLICPVNAIEMVEDEQGFLYPKIIEEKCIKCNRCKKYCANFNDGTNNGTLYMGINKDDNDLHASSSGGIFLLFAKQIIKENGIVFGVKYDKNMKAIHDYTDKIDELYKFCGSKYVRSDLNNSYKKVKDFLKQGKKVLFTGTSCQVQGLNIFLKKKYDNLITMDIICHANPSPKVFKLYIEELERNVEKKVIDVKFRDKEDGWKNQIPTIIYNDGTKEKDEVYVKAFLRELINRDSCYNCKFASEKRISDITIGDFWGVEKFFNEIDFNKGVSMFFVNTKKASEYLNKISDKLILEKLKFDQVKKYNHFEPISENSYKLKFYKELNKKNDTTINLLKKYSKFSIKYRVIRKIKHIINK